MKKANEFNKSASELVTASNTLSRLKGRNLWCSPPSRALAQATVNAARESLKAIESELERAGRGQQ